MKIRFLYHKGKDSWLGKAITGLTWFYALFYAKGQAKKYSYSHEEVWIPDKEGRFTHFNRYCPAKLFYNGKCLSSTTRGKWKGVRIADASNVLVHPERWDYIEVDNVDEERVAIAYEQFRTMCGAKYDYMGILGFLNPFPIQHSKWWYCSEICHWFKCMVNISKIRFDRISPRRSAFRSARVYGEPIPLA